MPEVIRDLIGQLRGAVESARGASRRAVWEPAPESSETRYYAVSDLPLRGVKGVPFTVFAGLTFWHRALALDLRDYYSDPLCYLEYYLRMRIRHLTWFDDCTAATKVIPIGFEIGRAHV